MPRRRRRSNKKTEPGDPPNPAEPELRPQLPYSRNGHLPEEEVIPPEIPSTSDTDASVPECTRSEESGGTLKSCRVEALEATGSPGRSVETTTEDPGKDSKAVQIPASVGIPIEITKDHDSVIFACPNNDNGLEVQQFLVSSHILSFSSPIFRAIFDSNQSHDKNETNTVQISCDYPSVLSIVFRLLHFDSVEDLFDIDFALFVQIAVICEEFELHRALRPWMYIWSEKHSKNALEPGYEDWLYISRNFGSGEKLEELIDVLVKECGPISDCGTYFCRGDRKVLTRYWPEDILERIISLKQNSKPSIPGRELESWELSREPELAEEWEW
ncbi:hypothetical protein TWF481_009879 [Arthrobotrys musiformis]|uniref:BTB domain-containing protein n=1 Tax=Arthrobotrys musiformis TaxID=47236 RepID=A0AAV9W726_9PEZI